MPGRVLGAAAVPVALPLILHHLPLAAGCDAGVFWGEKCTPAKAAGHDPDCFAYPTNAEATSSSTTLVWEKGGKGFGGIDDLGGDVFLSTTLNMGCGGGYYGSQMHWNTTAMNLDWAVWDIALPGGKGSTMNTHPINPTNEDGKPVRNGKLCSTVEPPPAGFVQCACSRYSGEGFGTHCGIGEPDGNHWELNQAYTLNISLLEGNASAALFGATITVEKTGERIEVGKILTTDPGPDKANPHGYACDHMVVGGGSFQEFYDGGNFSSWATISGPVFRGVAEQTSDIIPTGFEGCCFFGNCSGGYGGCHNETMTWTMTEGHGGLPAQRFRGGLGTEVPEKFVPPWYHWAKELSADGSYGPDGGTLPPSDACDFHFHTDRPGGKTPAHWGAIPYPGSQPYSMPDIKICNSETGGAGHEGYCSKLCCAYCVADPSCVQARLVGRGCELKHDDPKLPFIPWSHANNNSAGITTIVPSRRPTIAPTPPTPAPRPTPTDPPRPGTCTYIGKLEDFGGGDVEHTSYSGATDVEKDASCCAACEKNPKCEFWVRATDFPDCWLKSGFTGFNVISTRRGNFKYTPPPTP